MTDNIFQFTMSGLTAGLRVVHIAVLDLKTCDINQELKEVRANPELSGFDHVPVVSRSRIVGILEPRHAGNEGSVRDKIRQLDDSMLASADEPLTSFVPRLKTSPFRLVLKGTRIDGIVTRSDLIKLPVRLVAFTQICHLEMEMTALIRTRYIDDNEWVTQLHDHGGNGGAGASQFHYLECPGEISARFWGSGVAGDGATEPGLLFCL